VTITGTGFLGTTTVDFRALPATGVVVVSSTEITAVVPAQAAGVDNVFVTNSVGTSGAVTADHYTYLTPTRPVITGISPATGLTTGTNTVTITGTGFVGTTTVDFRALPATGVVVVSPSEITAVVPAQAAGVDNVFVTNSVGTSGAVAADDYTYVTPTRPVITAVTPNFGSTTGGTTVTITGTGFLGTTAVDFRGLPATSFTVVSATEITAVVPAQAAGVDNIFVTNSVGTSGAVVADHYTYTVS
jgi:hypothetical protein